MSNENSQKREPFKLTGDAVLDAEIAAGLCPDCYYPLHYGGQPCATCMPKWDAYLDVMCDALKKTFPRHLELTAGRGIHVHGRGLVDPWSPEGRRYLDG